MPGFSDQVHAWTQKTERKIETAVRKIALDVFTRAILKTPVRTGRARGNWQVAIGRIPSGTVKIDDRAGTATIGAVQAEVLGLRAGEAIFLVNNLPYIRRLEFGYSDQAPNGMVRLTVNEFEPLVTAISRELSRQ